jgi:glutathionylspermidine synthase
VVSPQFLNNTPNEQLQNAGWNWMLGTDTLPYLTNEVVAVKEAEANAYYEAANTLYDCYVQATQHIIDNGLWAEAGIPDNLVEMIQLTWDDDRHWHLYGRFDLAGGIDGKPIKLIEFNADTATCIPETSVVQWAHLKANKLNDNQQFNTLYESLVGQFETIRSQNPDLAPTLLISTMRDYPEDDTNVAILGEAAREAGFDVAYAFVDEVELSPTEGVFRQDSQSTQFEQFNFWFKLLPWEYIAEDEPEMADLLTQIVKNRKAVVLNPAYTLLFQSKYLLKVLWDLFPYHPLLLRTETKPLIDRPSVEKVLFGREGANVRILDEVGAVLSAVGGDYANQARVYQEYVEFPKDALGQRYQAGVFFAGEACALGFRRGGKIIDNTAQFVGHLVK